jgi:molecular chaperone GrpE
VSQPEDFDAVAAAKELEAELGELGLNAPPTSDEYSASLVEEIEELQTQLAQKDEELRKANQRADQANAEIEAVQRRVEGAAAKELEQRTRRLLEGFLPVLDNMDRAIAAARGNPASADVVEGVELVRREMLTTLAKFGVTHAPARGERFDPNRHEAIAVVPVADAAQDGIVIAVMREGYLIGDATLRPAGVAVGKRT